MTFLTVRVPESLRKKMRRIRGVNWSGVIRGAIEDRVEEETKRQRERDRGAIMEAVAEQDRLAEQLGGRPAAGWNSVEVIRYWREHRYSSSTLR